MKSTLYSFLLIAIVFIGVLFPLWPSELRVGVWYLSMGALGLVGGLFVIAIIRLILFVISLILPMTRPGIWLFPNLFADVGVIDSFIPLWGWAGVDYESQHLLKYRKLKKGGGKKSKKAKADRSSAESEGISDAKGKGKAAAEPDVLLRESSAGSISEDDEEAVEEIEAESRPLMKKDN